MKYMGSKARIAKPLAKIIQNYIDKNNIEYYIEPFVGGANLITEINSKNRLGRDKNKDCIKALMFIKDNIKDIPKNNKEFTEEDYHNIKQNRNRTELESFAGFAYSWGAKWKGGWCRDRKGKRDYVAEAYRNALKQSPKLQGVVLQQGNYTEVMTQPTKTLIYCDPPYVGTTGYKDKFNHKEFWEWAEARSLEGNIVLVSEYQAPTGWKSIWQAEINNSLNKAKAVERLFVFNKE